MTRPIASWPYGGCTMTRRAMLQRAGAATLGAALMPRLVFAASPAKTAVGNISGEATAEKVGREVLAGGGNVVDAIVAAALTAAVAAPWQTGIGGYGGTMILALAKRRKITCLDFNSAAPQAMREDVFKPDVNGGVPGNINQHGWLAAGVPGILAGLQMALDRYGTRSFRESVKPAIKLAHDGIPMDSRLAGVLKGSAKFFTKDAGSSRLYLVDGKPPAVGGQFCNPDLAAMLSTLAERNSVKSFYQGDIAQRIADAFRKNGGLVTVQDLAAYEAREIAPLSLDWGLRTVHTVPLTAGGLSVLQVLHALKALDWRALPAGFPRTHARIEALRVMWRDRLELLGDPDKTKVPVEKLLSRDCADETASAIRAAVRDAKILRATSSFAPQSGTISLSAADADGNLAALTLTHGESFGAKVTVDGLGLTLGHGMSRFDPHPGHPNGPGPGKRPLHNMCPSVVVKEGRPIMALGGRGGRRIPDAITEVLLQILALDQSLESALQAPRLHTEGGLDLTFEKAWPAEEVEASRRLGYKVKTGASATISAAAYDPATGECLAALR